MMRHLTPADYHVMPWKNGRGQTVEMVRQDLANGQINYRLSIATVVENGPFSVFPGLNRSLTVIDGPGFDLIGEHNLRADPLEPVMFPGDARMVAANVTAPSQDFNVMAWKPLRMAVSVVRQGQLTDYSGELLFYFALAPATVGEFALGKHDLLYGRPKQVVSGGPVILVRLD
ncbi:HutD/Ves family protein [Tabrizicola sp.]|uniref:HutD/Ves family protein n=1 Tax=Tabrizicola sp. TaxID=2005166 RepID=UPI003F32A258